MEHQSIAEVVDDDRLFSAHGLGKYCLAEVVQHVTLYGSLHWAGTKFRVVAHFGEVSNCIVCPIQCETLRCKHCLYTVELQGDYL